MAQKKTESMLTRQRRLLKEQRAKKAAAKSNASKSLPSRGQTGGNSLKSRGQRKGTAKRIAGQQQRVISEAMRKTMKQRQALDKKEAAAKGTKGSKVQTGTRTKGGALKRQGSSAVKPSRKGAAASTRVQKVKVRVEPQKALKAGSQKALPPSKKALPAGKKGGALATTKGPRRRNINGKPSNGTQLGTKGSAKAQLRLPKATIRSAGAASKALSNTGKVAGRIALPLAAYAELKGLKDSLDRGEGYARIPGLVRKLAKGNGKKKTSGAKTNSRGRRVGAVPASKTKPSTTPKKRGMSNIPPSEGSRNNPNYGKPGKPRSATKPTPTKKPAPTKSTPARKATPRAATGANAQNLRSGPTPPKPAKATKPAKKVYGSTGRKDLKQSKRMADALKNLKVRKYKK